MVRLRTLGTLDLSLDRADEANGLARQPKRLALLTFLVLRSSSGPIRRDKLLGLFWPDLSQTRGRRALSQSLYVLRHSLGDDLVQTVGQEAIRLDLDFISCDAIEFEEALRRGDSEHALSLYGGDLLDGFYLSDAAGFEQWLEVERARLRRLAAEAARALASRDEAAGDLLAASRWARRLTRLTPWDEENVIYLLGLLQRAGDQSGVQLEYDLYSRRLRTELEVEPSAAVKAAYHRPVDRLATGSPGLPDEASEPPDAPEEPRRAPWVRPTVRRRWRTPTILTVAVVVSILAFAETSRQAFRGPGGDRRIPGVLVAPLANETGDGNLDAMARRAADWLGNEIARTGRIRVIPPVSALRLVERTEIEGDTTTFGRAVAAGARVGVDLVLGGYVTGNQDSTVYEVYGLDPITGELLFALQPVGPAEGANQSTLQRLRRVTIGALAGQLDERMRQWTGPASKPPSFESYQEYAEALDTFLSGDWVAQERAAEMFLAAWRSDTTFTAPLIWSIFALVNSGQGERADSVAHSLEPGTAALPEWDRAMLRYHLAFLHGDLAAQYRTAAEVVSLAPDSEWRFLLALAAKRIGCREEALSLLRDLSPRSGWMSRWSPSYWTTRLDVRHLRSDPGGEFRDADAALEQLTDEVHPGEAYRAFAAHIRAAATGATETELAGYLGDARSLGRRAHRLWLKLLLWGPLDLASSRVEYQAILDSARAWYADRPEVERDAVWYLYAQWALAYRGGRWTEAEGYADQLTAAGWPPDPAYALGPRALLFARRGDAARARAILDSIPPDGHLASYSDYDPDFFRARVEAILGEPANAVAYLRSANRRGIPYEAIQGMARIDFEPMWDYRPLRRLLEEHSCEGL